MRRGVTLQSFWGVTFKSGQGASATCTFPLMPPRRALYKAASFSSSFVSISSSFCSSFNVVVLQHCLRAASSSWRFCWQAAECVETLGERNKCKDAATMLDMPQTTITLTIFLFVCLLLILILIQKSLDTQALGIFCFVVCLQQGLLVVLFACHGFLP